MAKIALMNNYSMLLALHRYQAGNYPGQHLWGAADMTRHSWLISAGLSDPGRMRPANPRFRSLILRLIGDPFQWLRVWALRREIDGVFVADQWSATGLLILRRLGLFSPPIAVLVHHCPGRVNRAVLRNADLVFVLSPDVRRSLAREGFRAPVLLSWGADTDWAAYRSAPRTTHDFVAAGKTYRDLRTLRRAVQLARASGVIVTAASQEHYVDGELAHQTCQTTSYADVVSMMGLARVVAIPLLDDSRLSGLTEVIDTMAVGRRAIVTRSKHLQHVVPPSWTQVSVGAVSEWVHALRESACHPEARHIDACPTLEQFHRQLNEELSGMIKNSGA